MKVLHVSTAATWRGGEQQASYLIRHLSQLNINCCLMAPQHAAMLQHLHSTTCRIFSFRKTGSLNLGLAKKLSAICKQEHIDLIHTHDSHAHTAAYLSALFFRNKCPIVVSRRVDFAVSDSFFSKHKYNYPSIKKIICVSEAIRQITAPAIKDQTKLAVVHSGVDLNRFIEGKLKLHQEYHLPEDTFLVGNISALADHKDLHTFVRTASRINKEHKNIHFFLIGEGNERNSLQQEVDALKLNAHVHFTGFRNDIHELLPELNIFLMTSKTEGLGTTLIDAMAAGVCVVATKAGGIPELIQHQLTGLLAEIGDDVMLANHVNHLYQHPEEAALLRNNAKKQAAQFSFEQMAQKTLAIYQEVLSTMNGTYGH
jgi:glycosyltransferase involved in cell wall biosynthesis